MIDFKEIINGANQGKYYIYSSDHFNIRISYNDIETSVRIQIKGSELCYSQTYLSGELSEKGLERVVMNTIKNMTIDFQGYMIKELLKWKVRTKNMIL